MEWFEEWFDSPLYEKLYANRDEAEAARLGKLLERLIPKDSFPEILDLGCGRGRHSLYLAKKGYSVTGIDLSTEAIKTAKKKASRLNLANIHFEERDMRDPMDRKFDAIINLFTTFGYFEDDEENVQVLEAQTQMLREKGKVIIDFMNAAKVREEFEPHSEGSIDNLKYRIERKVDGDIIRKEIEFYGDGTGKTRNYMERVKLYEPEWFITELGKRGFTIEQTLGDYNGADFEEDESERFIIVAVRK